MRNQCQLSTARISIQYSTQSTLFYISTAQLVQLPNRIPSLRERISTQCQGILPSLANTLRLGVHLSLRTIIRHSFSPSNPRVDKETDIPSQEEQSSSSSVGNQKEIVPKTDDQKLWLCVLKTHIFNKEEEAMSLTVKMLSTKFRTRVSRTATEELFYRMQKDRDPIYQRVIQMDDEDDTLRDIMREIRTYKITLIKDPPPGEYPISSPERKRWLCLGYDSKRYGVRLDTETMNKIMNYKFQLNYDPLELQAQHKYMKEHQDPIYLEVSKSTTPETLEEIQYILRTKEDMELDERRRARESTVEFNAGWRWESSTAPDSL